MSDYLVPTKPECCRAYWAIGPSKGALISAALEQNATDRILLRTRHSGISRGTETRVALGLVPLSEHDRMRCPNQAGDFPFPVKYGYCSVAQIIEGPDELLGLNAFALHPHQDFYSLHLDAITLLPNGLPPARAILAANMETVLNAVWDAGIGPGDRVLVIGAGTLGLLLTYLLARIPGCEVNVCDINPERRLLVEQMGAVFTKTGDLPEDTDFAFNTSGSHQGLAMAINHVGLDGMIVEVSWLGSSAPLALDGAFHSKRLTIKSSQVGQLPPHRRPRWDYKRRLNKALELLASAPELDALITHHIAFDELPQTMAMLCDGWSDALTICVDYP